MAATDRPSLPPEMFDVPSARGVRWAIISPETGDAIEVDSDWIDRIFADARFWREAEAEGHIVDFTEDGYGLQHPPSCRPDLIGCDYNVWLAALPGPHGSPGRYRMHWDEPRSAPHFDRLDG